jgi:predicted short-subunit dehydrogenase-like oxidoreductase (DUF2520 family)
MLARSMARTLSIVGAGRVGKTLAKRLRALGWRICAVVTRSPGSARAAVRVISGGSPFGKTDDEAFLGKAGAAILSADVVLIATPDRAMESAVKQLAESGGRAWRGKVVLHSSGALDSSVLGPLTRLGAFTGSIHPMQTFSGRGVPKLEGVTFAIEGLPRAQRVALSMARSLGGAPVLIASRDKPVYHATAALAGGSGFALIEASMQMLVRIGFTRRRALETLLPLMRQMLDNIERLGPRAAWTGPLSRGDYAVVAKHVRALRRYPREFQQAYAALALLAGRTLSSDPGTSLTHIARALKDDKHIARVLKKYKRIASVTKSSGRKVFSKNRLRRNRS